ncbi:hypothetical protein [Janthinobacterium sp. PSPC3-1]|uniref:hypothetical protein n=1 Tax=Janthinobacterium sp. PSPC3-1 TaxID=2804653 RepID=UPI003CEB24F0
MSKIPNEQKRKEIRIIVQYKDFFDILSRYWAAHGKWSDIIYSPYFHIAVFISAISSNYWLSHNWYEPALASLPTLLGFGVSGYAIWIGWGNDKMRDALIKLNSPGADSAYIRVSAIFAHFGLVQVTALILAIICQALNYSPSQNSILAMGLNFVGLSKDFFHFFKPVGDAFGYFFFVYSIMSILEATLALFRLATWFQRLGRT